MVKNISVQEKMSEVKCIDAEKVQNHGVDCRGLVCTPQDGVRVVLHIAWCDHACCKDCHQEGSLVLKVGFCEHSLDVCVRD